MNIYIFGSEQYTTDIYKELEDKLISLYLGGEVIHIKEASQLIDVIQTKQDDDLFLIDDTIIKKGGDKKSLFSFFNKQKFLIDEKDIDRLAESTLEADSIADAVSQIMEIIDQKKIDELESIDEPKISTYEKLVKQADEITEIGDELDMDDLNLDELDLSIDEEATPDIKIEMKQADDFSQLDQLDESTLLDAFKDFTLGEDRQEDNTDSVALTLTDTNSASKSEQIKNLTKAFEQLLENNKKIKLTIEVCD